MKIPKRRLAGWLQRPPLRWGLAVAMRLFAPRNCVGAVGAIFNDAGQVLLVEHVFRVDYNWGLPGGWVERGEDPAHTVAREVREELNLRIEVKKLLLCEPQGREKNSIVPLGLSLAYYCRLPGNASAAPNLPAEASNRHEILSLEWVDPRDPGPKKLVPLQRKAIELGRQEFEREKAL